MQTAMTIQEFRQQFQTEADCLNYLIAIKSSQVSLHNWLCISSVGLAAMQGKLNRTKITLHICYLILATPILK